MGGFTAQLPREYVSPVNHAPQGADNQTQGFQPLAKWLNTDGIMWVLQANGTTQGACWLPHGPSYMGELGGINLNSAPETQVGMANPATTGAETVRYIIDRIVLHSCFGASNNITTAQCSFWSGAGKTGTMIAPQQSLAGLGSGNQSIDILLAKNWRFTGAAGVNTGNGTVGSIAVGASGGIFSKVGTYTITLTSPTAFTVLSPEGYALPSGTVGTPYTNAQINFTITAGGIPFINGDTFTIAATANQFSFNGGNGDGPLYFHPEVVEGSDAPNYGITVFGHINF